jgi:uncharacterized protein (UPF0333 family)
MDIKGLLAKFKLTKTTAGVKGKLPLRFDLLVYAIVILVLVLDAYVLQAGIRKIFQARTDDVGAKQIATTRVNFESYNAAVKRIGGAESFVPNVNIARNPFAK